MYLERLKKPLGYIKCESPLHDFSFFTSSILILCHFNYSFCNCISASRNNFLLNIVISLKFKMFRVTATKYSDMQQITANIAKGINQLNEKYRELQPYLEQIDQVRLNFEYFLLSYKFLMSFGPKFIESLTKLMNNFYFKLIRTAQLDQNIFIRIKIYVKFCSEIFKQGKSTFSSWLRSWEGGLILPVFYPLKYTFLKSPF